jgi:acetyl-CoA synthetase
VRSFSYDKGNVHIKFFEGAKTNITYNCLDRNVENGLGDRVAILWEGNEPGEDAKYTYAQLKDEVCKFANVLKDKGVRKGDRVSIYMPMVPQLAIAMMACARIGAIHSIVFGGFSADSLADRILDSACTVLVTTDGTYRGKKPVSLKANADQAMAICKEKGHDVTTCVVVERVGSKIDANMVAGRDEWWHEMMKDASTECEPEWMDAEDPLFILYTSGSTGKPKGV